MVKLTILDGPDIGRVFTVPPGPIVIGRGDDCEVILHDAMVSRHHCRIDEEESIFTVSDLRTPNGIFLNRGHSRIGTRTLIDGDEISLGHSRLRVELPRPGEEQSALLKMDPATDSTLSAESLAQVIDPSPQSDPTLSSLPKNWQAGMTTVAPRPIIPPPPASYRAASQPTGVLGWLRRLFSGFIRAKAKA